MGASATAALNAGAAPDEATEKRIMHRLKKPIWLIEADPANPGDGGGGKPEKPESFTQADVDRIVKERVQRERAKYADYDDLKAKAEGAKTAEERMAELEKEIAATKHEAMKRRVQAAYQISDEDADLFLTGADEESLTAQAERLADRESERKKRGNRVPSEGKTPSTAGDEGMREFTRTLFARANAD